MALPSALLILPQRRAPRSTTPTKHHLEAHPTPQQQQARRRPCHPEELIPRARGHIRPEPMRVDQRDKFKRKDRRDDRGNADTERAQLEGKESYVSTEYSIV